MSTFQKPSMGLLVASTLAPAPSAAGKCPHPHAGNWPSDEADVKPPEPNVHLQCLPRCAS
eukprot:2745830-Amphidinium_carterae.1